MGCRRFPVRSVRKMLNAVGIHGTTRKRALRALGQKVEFLGFMLDIKTQRYQGVENPRHTVRKNIIFTIGPPRVGCHGFVGSKHPVTGSNSLTMLLGHLIILIRGSQSTGGQRVHGWFSDNFNFCCIILLYFGISNFIIYPVYTSSFKYIIPDLNTNNAKFGIFTSFWRLFCTNLSIKCHHRHICICLQKIIDSVICIQREQKCYKCDSIKAIQRIRIQCTGFTVIYNIHFKIVRKNWRVRQFFHCETNA